MNMKAQSDKNIAASQRAAILPSGCKACERQGVAIYPLRVAAVPRRLVSPGWLPAVPEQETVLSGGEFKYALRTLREGYVYILLDNTVWQGYQVTGAGFLRQFDAYDMPQGERVEPLSPACLTHHHDVIASFINIPPGYREAKVAFSSDPWSRTVLDEYQNATRPDTRFIHLTLADNQVTVRENNRSLTLKPDLKALTTNVLEFATESYLNITGEGGKSDGAHGFYPRMSQEKQVALANRIALLQQQFVAPVCALVLDDPAGVVQELNHARLDVVEALAKYRSIPDNLHQSTISDIILNIRDSIVKQTKGDPTIKDFGTPGASYASTRESQIAIKISQALSRLEKYYDEPARAAFAQGYKNAIDGYQYKMTAIVKDLEAAYRAALWLTVIRQDYSPATSVISWAAQLNMLAGSLQGGMVGMNKDNSVWHDWMKDPDSPPFISLLGKEAGLINAVYNGSASYANLKTLLNSQEVCDFVDSLNFTIPVSSLTMSMNGAFSLVKNTLSEKANAGFVRTLQALAWVSEGEPAVTIFSGEITVREFQDIMLKQLDSQGRPVWSTLRQSGSYTQNTSHTGAWLQVTEPELLERKIPVRFASLLKDIESPAFKQAARRAGSSACALRKGSILKDGSRLADFPGLILAQDAVDNALMTGEMSMGLGDALKIARQQYQLPRRVFSSSGLGFVLGAVMLGLQKSALDDNLNALQAAIPGDAQATMKLTSSVLMVTASAVEMIGFGHMVARWGTDPWNMKPNVIVRGAEIYAHPLIRVAGVIGGIASVVDGIALGIKAWDAQQAGNSKAASLYLQSTLATFSSGLIGMYAGFSANFALFGPVGLCIGLAILGAVLATMAESEVRSPLEVWLSDTCFGIQDKRGKYDEVWNAKSLADLQEAINAYRTIASGVSAQLRRERLAEAVLNTAGTGLLAVQVKLPDCSKDGSDWLVELTAQGEYDSQLLARSASSAKQDSVKTQAQQHVDISPMGSMGMSATLPANAVIKESWEKSGLLLEGEFALNMTRFTGAEVKVTYWPDKTCPDNSLQLTASV